MQKSHLRGGANQFSRICTSGLSTDDFRGC